MKVPLLVVAALLLGTAHARGDDQDQEEGGQGNGTPPPAGGTTTTVFTPTGPYSRSKDEGEHQTPPGTLPNEVSIIFSPGDSTKCNACDSIVLIQTVQMFVDGQRIRPDNYSNLVFSQVAETWTIPDQPGTPNTNENGTYLDSPGAPSTHGSTAGSKVPGHTTSSGIDVPLTNADATLIDPPMAEGGNRRFKSPGNPNGYQTVVWKFETCAFCERGADAGKFYECITWEHTRTAADAAANPSKKGKSEFKGQSDAPTDGYKAAYQKFKQLYP